MVVSSDLYPNLVADRNAAAEGIKDKDGKIIPDDQYFVPLAPITLRRTSNLFTVNEMYDASKRYTTTNLPGTKTMIGVSKGPGDLDTTYKVGSSISYEIKDKTGVTTILGRTFMSVDRIDTVENSRMIPRGGFGIQVNDIDNNSQYRDILYVDNNSQLSVNSIQLGGHTLNIDADGNLCFDGKIVKLS